jgi:hypothetical protein
MYQPELIGSAEQFTGVLELMFLAGIVSTVMLAEATVALTSVHLGISRDVSNLRPSDLEQRATLELLPLTIPVQAQNIVDMHWLAGTPLPTLEALHDSCVMVAEAGMKSWFICASPSAESCEPDEDFSAYYGQPVYLCG